MATSPVVIDVVDERNSNPAKLPLMPLLLAGVLAIVISVLSLGGIGYYLVRSGRVAAPVATTAAAKPESSFPPPTHDLILEPIVVNLADAGGKTYLRVGIALRLIDPALKKDEKPKEEKAKDGKGGDEAEAAVRDTTLEVLGRQTAADLLAIKGKETLKTELKAALKLRNADLQVADIYFTEFLVQQ